MMIQYLLISSIIAFSLSYPLYSQSGKKYSLQECIQLGLASNVELLRSHNEVERSRTFKKQAFGKFLPDLSASGSWNRFDQDQIGFRSNDLFTSRNNFSYNVRSNLVLFDGFSNFNSVDRSLLNLKASQKGVERRSEDIVFGIEQQFYNALRLHELVEVNESNLERSRSQLKRIKEFNQVGSVPMADVYRQQVQVGRDELSLLQSKNDYENALVDLQILIGLDPRMQMILDISGVPKGIDAGTIEQYRNQLGSIEEIVAHARKSRADIQQAELSKQSAAKAVSISKAGHLPSLEAFASYSWNNLELKDFAVYDRFVYGLAITVPIFANFQTQTAIEQAEIDQMNAEYTFADLDRTIAGEIRKAMNSLAAAEKNVEIAKRTLQSAEEDNRIASERYSLGAGTLLDQMIASANLKAGQSDVVNSTFNYLIAQKQLEYQIGKLTY